MTFTFEHPLRKIQWDYDADKKQTELEAKGFASYKLLHDRLWELKQGWTHCTQRVEELKDLFSKTKEAYHKLESETRKYGTLAGYTEQETAGFNLPDTATLDFHDLSILISAVEKAADSYNQETQALDAFYEATEEKQELFDQAFERFNKEYFSPILRNYDEVQLDTVTFDDDFELFREASCEVGELRDSYVDQWNTISEARKTFDPYVATINEHVDVIVKKGDRLMELGRDINPN